MPHINIYCNKIQFIPVPHIDTISGTTITPKAGFSLSVLKGRKVAIDENSKHLTAGDLISQQLEVKYSESTQVLQQLINLPQVVRITRDDGTVLLFGSLANPSLAVASGIDANGGTLKFTRKSTTFEFILDKADQFS